jgi:predicted dehydrogenase
MKEKVGIGIIGTGFARRVQIPSFLECENVEIVSVASGQIANARATASEFGIKHFTDDWRETVDNADVDLVCITTPPDSHFEMTMRALENGKHVLGEKPMAMNADEARKMTEKAREKNVLALIDHELRFLHGRQKAFAMLRNGEIGKVRHAKADFRAPQRGDANLPWNWWSDKSAGGGALGAVVSHSVDSLFWFLGTEISEVFCQLQTHVKQRKDANSELREVTTDDETNLIVRFADSDLTEDATGIISASMVEYPKYQNRMEFFGTKGAIRVEHRGDLFLASVNDSDWTQVETEIGKTPGVIFDSGFPSGFMAFAPKIIEAIRQGKTEIEHAATFADGVKVQKVLDAARSSNESGAIVKIDY